MTFRLICILPSRIFLKIIQFHIVHLMQNYRKFTVTLCVKLFARWHHCCTSMVLLECMKI